MTSLALVFPYSDVAKSHVCQKETKGCQKERMGGNKRSSFLWSFDVAAGRYYRYIPYMQKKTRPTVDYTDQSRSPTANYMYLDFVQLKSGLGATLHSRRAIAAGKYSFAACIHSLQRIKNHTSSLCSYLSNPIHQCS